MIKHAKDIIKEREEKIINSEIRPCLVAHKKLISERINFDLIKYFDDGCQDENFYISTPGLPSFIDGILSERGFNHDKIKYRRLWEQIAEEMQSEMIEEYNKIYEKDSIHFSPFLKSIRAFKWDVE